MSRRQVFKVVDYPPCVAGVEYQGRVQRIRKGPRADHFRVILELLNKEQEGRCVEFTLSYPIRPSGMTSSFFQASGLAVAVGAEIDPQEAVGQIVRVCFETCDDGEVRPASLGSPGGAPALPGRPDSPPDRPTLFPQERQ